MMRPSLLLTNANIRTLDPRQPPANTIAIQGQTINAVGAREELEDFARGATVVDLEGRTILPGFNDAHVHLLGYGWFVQQVNLNGAASLDEVLDRVTKSASKDQSGGWLQGRGWNQNDWVRPVFPTRHDLDRRVPDRPVALRSHDGHSVWVNTVALRLAGVTADTADPPGGEISREPGTAEPSGILKEAAIRLIDEAMPSRDETDVRAALRAAIDRAHRAGVTSVTSFERSECFAPLQQMALDGELSLRLNVFLYRDFLEDAIHLGIRTGFGNPLLRFGGIKFFADGALGSHTAAMLEPYDTEPENRGILVLQPDELQQMVAAADRAGLAAAIHAIGDQANRMALDAFEHVRRHGSGTRLRHRIEHCQIVDPADVPRFKELGVIASVQPIHATSDRDTAERLWGRRNQWSYAYKSLLASGAAVALGTDAPVESIEPLKTIHAAVTRKRAGEPDQSSWHPEQCLTVAEAVQTYTVGSAYAAGEEHLKGTIQPGQLADLVVLSDDIFEIAPDAILKTKVEMTIVGGQIVYPGSSHG